ncbi:hypothetical protein AZH53_10215 [Methanomicrobiaceae archaeon CYW5]|uniref:DUF4435 domain-containing protein n=1 Tax=Methanovulcanius yangii TaxID=1789227 RepID=UPI0029CA7338|nr:DUF4435 domain-containing protein [Methanovulcanius yangii]MBT8508779.1 hypothetical protein [Methanovulcanius yangii]
MKGKNRRFAGYRLEEIWADPDEIRGTVEKMEMNYPGNGGKVFVIVEGPYDLEVYDRCFNRDSTILRIANSKENVRDVVADILAQSGEGDASHIIGIIDSDFSLFTGSGIKGKNLFITDTHDLETMLIASPALDRVIEHVAAGAIQQSFSQRVQGDLRGADLRHSLTKAARYLGFAILVNNRRGLNITFKHINCKKRDNFARFIDAETLECNLSSLVGLIVEKNGDRGDAFIEALREEMGGSAGYYFEYPWHICRGHDLICILLRDLSYRYPPRSGGELRGRDLEALLRSYYRAEYFARTDLCDRIRAWEETVFGKGVEALFVRSVYNQVGKKSGRKGGHSGGRRSGGGPSV